MSESAAYVRDINEMRKLYEELTRSKENFFEENAVKSNSELPDLHKRYDTLITQIAVLSAMIFAAENVGSRGSALVKGAAMDTGQFNDNVIITKDGKSHFEPVRPMPLCDDWFETVWSGSSDDD